MKRLSLLALPLMLALTACVDTTGLSGELKHAVRGNASAPVVLAEYADIECPACRAAHLTLNTPLLEKYGAQVRFEFRHFPLRNIHRYAMDLAEATECAADQGKFWEYVDLAYDKQAELKKGSTVEWATQLKLDMDTFGRCTRSHIKREAILAEYESGRKLGVTGTPTYFVNGKRVESTIDDISAAIDAALKGSGQRL